MKDMAKNITSIQSAQPAEPEQHQQQIADGAVVAQSTAGFGKRKLLLVGGGAAALIVFIAMLGYFWFRRGSVSISLSPQATPEVVSQASPSPSPVPAAKLDTSSWLTYRDTAAGLSFKYPQSVILNDQADDETKLALTVAAEKLSDIPEDLPSLMGRNDALKLKAELAAGGAGVIDLGPLNGQTSTTLAQFEVCSVMFVRKLIFFPGQYRVMLIMTAPVDKVQAAMPEFFEVDAANCGTQTIWNFDRQDDFETALQNNQGQGIAQEWYDTFNTLLSTIELTTPASPSPVPVSRPSYKNEVYGFELIYPSSFRLQTSKEDLYGYPHGIALLYSGGQVYDVVIEVWDSPSEYQAEYAGRLADLKVITSQGKYITFLNNAASPESQAVIDSVKLSQ